MDIELRRLTDHLHEHKMHPDYDYEMTTCGRKDYSHAPEGEGWEPNVYGGDPHSSWERFDYHEEHWWRRLKTYREAEDTDKPETMTLEVPVGTEAEEEWVVEVKKPKPKGNSTVMEQGDEWRASPSPLCPITFHDLAAAVKYARGIRWPKRYAKRTVYTTPWEVKPDDEVDRVVPPDAG